MKAISRLLLISIMFCVVSGRTGAQVIGIEKFNRKISLVDTTFDSAVKFKFKSLSFFQNNEYFSNYAKGYTLPGYWVEPTVTISTGDFWQLETGARLSRMFGKDSLTDKEWLFRATCKVSDNLLFVFGSLNETPNHGMPDALYDSERWLTGPAEKGLQILYNNPIVDVDVWINWEKYIVDNSPFQEEFTAGFTVLNHILKGNNCGLTVDLPLYLIAKHRGGQIDNSQAPLESIVVPSAGLALQYPLGNNTLALNSQQMLMALRSELPSIPFKSGNASYTWLTLYTKYISASAGYYMADKFYSPRGKRLLQSVPYKGESGDFTRSLADVHLNYFRDFAPGCRFNIGFQGYYDTKINLFDYSYGFLLRLNLSKRLIKL